MKKIIFAILLVLPVLSLRADERSQEVLRKMSAALNSYNSYKVRFTANMEGEFKDLPGTLLVSKNKYWLEMNDSQVFFDGTTGYTYSEDNEEVIIETPDPKDNTLFANPAKIFQLYERDFNSTLKGAVLLRGKNTMQIELTPKAANTDYNKVILYTDTSGLPVRVVYHLPEYGGDLILDVISLESNVAVTDDMFRFDTTKYPEVEVIDFR